MAEDGICGRCGSAALCLDTNQGWMCRDCFHGALKNPGPKDRILYTLPPEGQKLWVLKEPPDNYLTIGGILYAFHKEADARTLLERVRASGASRTAFVELVDAKEPFGYVLSSMGGLRILSIEGFVEGKTVAGPNEAEVPRL